MANYAMHVQALQADKNREKPRYEHGKKPSWRPFQLAFVLLNLASVADREHADRGVADLIYFPPQGVEFAAFQVPEKRADLPAGVGRLILVPELREVRVQVSFSRFASLSANLQGKYDLDRQGVRPATLTLPTGNEKWLPAAEIRGEGLFFELDADTVADWERRGAV